MNGHKIFPSTKFKKDYKKIFEKPPFRFFPKAVMPKYKKKMKPHILIGQDPPL